MSITQFSIITENKVGKLAEIIKDLGYEGINIRGLAVNQSEANKREVMLVVNDPVKAERIFKENMFYYKKVPLIAIEIPDTPGSLFKIASLLADHNINIDYSYTLLCKREGAIVVFKVDDLEKSLDVLEINNINIVKEEELYLL